MVQAMVAIPVAIVDNPSPGEDLSTWATIVSLAATAVSWVCGALLVALRRGGTPRGAFRELGLRGFRPAALKWMGLAVVAYLAFSIPYVLLTGEPDQEISEELGPVAAQILLIAIAAPITEEIYFRGTLFSGFRERMPRLPAALISGTIFGLLHIIGADISVAPPLILFGVILALLYEKTGSIVPGILLHMLNNSVALLGQ
jgi:uncharacterized protein